MFRSILRSKLVILFISLVIIGFFIGYDYALITSGDHDTDALKLQQEQEPGMQTGEDYYYDVDTGEY